MVLPFSVPSLKIAKNTYLAIKTVLVPVVIPAGESDANSPLVQLSVEISLLWLLLNRAKDTECGCMN